MPDFTNADMAALVEMVNKEAEAVARANEAYLDLSASYGGPLAEAQREYIKNLAEIERIGKEAMRTPEEIKALTDAETARYEANVAGINNMTEAAQENIRMMDGVRYAFNDFFMDVFTGTKSVVDAFKDMVNNIAAQITQRIVNGWMDQLFGKPGTQGSGAGGNMFSSLLSMIFGGGRASGGWTSPNKLYEVNERGFEMATVGGRDYMLTGNSPVHITPNHRLGGGMAVTQNFYNPVMANRQTEAQRQREAARNLRRQAERA